MGRRRLVNAFVEADIVPKKALDSLRLLDRRLGKMSGPENASLWTWVLSRRRPNGRKFGSWPDGVFAISTSTTSP